MPIPLTLKNPMRALKARWLNSFNLGNTLFTTPAFNPRQDIDYACDNNFEELAWNAARTDPKSIWRFDSDDQLRIGGECVQPMRGTINFPLATNASIVGQQFFIAPFPMKITKIDCIFATANGAALTGTVEKLTSGVAPGSGQVCMTDTFNLNATANTLQTGTLPTPNPVTPSSVSYPPYIQLNTGDRLAFKLSTPVTSLAGLVVTIMYNPGGKTDCAVYNMQANGDLVDQSFYVANRSRIITRIDYVHSTLGTNGSAVSLDVKKCTGTQAAASGTSCLTATFNCKSAINVVQNGALAAASVLRMDPGDRLAIDYTGTLTALAGVVVVVTFQSIRRQKDITFTLSKNANLGVDQAFWIADTNYYVYAVSAVWGVAAGGVSTLQLTRDKATDAPGAGSDLLASTGWNLNGTAETPSVKILQSDFTDVRFNYIMAGERLSLDFANSVQSSAGLTVTVSLDIA